MDKELIGRIDQAIRECGKVGNTLFTKLDPEAIRSLLYACREKLMEDK